MVSNDKRGRHPEHPDVTAAKKQFAQRLFSLLAEKGWTQAELARRTGLGRDTISLYINGHNLPEPKNSQKLADALGVAVHVLHPRASVQPDAPQSPEIEFSSVSGGRGWLRINTQVSTPKALKILAILQDEGA